MRGQGEVEMQWIRRDILRSHSTPVWCKTGRQYGHAQKYINGHNLIVSAYGSFTWIVNLCISLLWILLNTVELGYNELGYNETSAITRPFKSPVFFFYIFKLIYHPYNEQKKSFNSAITRYSFSDTLNTRLFFN